MFINQFILIYFYESKINVNINTLKRIKQKVKCLFMCSPVVKVIFNFFLYKFEYCRDSNSEPIAFLSTRS